MVTKENNFYNIDRVALSNNECPQSIVHCFCHIHKNMISITFSDFRKKIENIKKNYKIMTNKSIYFL